MKAVKVVFKNGVFVPIEEVNLKEGEEGIVVFNEGPTLPQWWDKLNLREEIKEALSRFSEKISFLPIKDVKVSVKEEELEIFVLTDDERDTLSNVMKAALEVYEELGVYFPVQVISSRRLERWKEQRREIYQVIERSPSIR